ncbi:MAG: HAMP domain-containing protein [Deltaproteobacteria bacterium]|nr:HAMP domain-containing protein [Deltaproteobacteria bacterium]
MFRTLTSRLTVRYTILFAVLSIVVFVIVYATLSSSMKQKVDKELQEEVVEFGGLYQAQGLATLDAVLQHEAASEGLDRAFFLLLSPEKEIRASSDLSSWQGIDFMPDDLDELGENQHVLRTISIPDRARNVRVIYKRLVDGHLLEIGVSVEDKDALMAMYREMFLTAIMVMILCGSIMGRFTARRAMSGVERVTQAAVSIGKDNINQRVLPGNEGAEIDGLATAFNDMLARIQNLLAELQDVTNNIAHDLRSPITRIRGIAETTATGEAGIEEYREMAGIIVEECDRLVEMINTMLEIATADSGLAKFSHEPVNVGELVAQSCDLFSPLAEEKSIVLECKIPPESIKIETDIARLQRAVANILDNAIKYTPDGGTVSVKVERDGQTAMILIADSGIGIVPSDLPRIFERFYRGDHSRSSSGNGLGLSYADAVIRAHGGKILVESLQTKGSSFTVVLPGIIESS